MVSGTKPAPRVDSRTIVFGVRALFPFWQGRGVGEESIRLEAGISYVAPASNCWVKPCGVLSGVVRMPVLRSIENGSVSLVTAVQVEGLGTCGRKSRCDQFGGDLDRFVLGLTVYPELGCGDGEYFP